MLDLIGAMAAARTGCRTSLLRARRALPALRRRAARSCTTSRAGAARRSCNACAAHGAYQSFAQFLEEKGLLRPMSRVDRAKLLRDARPHRVRQLRRRDRQRRRALSVLPLGPEPARRRPARARARSARDDRAAGALPARGAAGALQCAACGAALPPGETMTLLAVRRDAGDRRASPRPMPACRRSRRRCAPRPRIRRRR